MHRLVIARYAEQLDWVVRVPADFDVVIVNKGAPLNDPGVLARARVVARPNMGREGETYLAYIEQAREGTDESGFTVFAQGDPFEHSPDFLALLQRTADWQDVQPLSWRWKVARDIPPSAILARETADFIAGLRVRPEIFSLSSWAPLGFDDAGTQWLNATYRSLHGLPEGTNIAAHFLAKVDLAALAASASAHVLGRFSYGAVFGVRSSLLAKLPAIALARLREATCAHSVYGYVLERLWLHLFGMAFIMPIGAVLPADQTADTGSEFLPQETEGERRRRKIVKAVRRVGGLVAGP